LGQALLLVSVSGCWAPFWFRSSSWFSLRTLFPVLRFTWFSDPIGIAASSSLKIIPFGLKCTVFSAADLFSPSFEFPFYKITTFVAAATDLSFSRWLLPWGLCLCYSVSSWLLIGIRIFCVQQGSYFRLRGTGGIQSFCFSPVCTSVIVFVSFQYCYCFVFRLAPFRALLQLCTVCIERLLYSFAWICCSFAEIFHLFSAVRSSSSLPKHRSGFTTLPKQWGGLCSSFRSFSEDPELLRRTLKCCSDCSEHLFSFFRHLHFLDTSLCRSSVLYFDPVKHLRTDFVNKRSSDSWSHCCFLSFEALTPKGLVASLCQLCALHLMLLPSRVLSSGVYLFQLIHADLTYSLLKNVVTEVTLFGFQATHQPFSEDPGCCQNAFQKI
jgi:hypothetical protein